MGADCSSEALPPRSVRPSPVVSSLGDKGRARTRRSHDRVDDEFNFDFEFDYDLESLSSIDKPKRKNTNNIQKTRANKEPSLSSSSSDESGCSGNHSFVGYVPKRKIDTWFETLPRDPAAFKAIKEEEVWSDGEREGREWLQTEASAYFYDDGKGGANAAMRRPAYVMALGLQSDGEREELEEHRRLQQQKQKQQQAKRQQQQRPVKKTRVSRCA